MAIPRCAIDCVPRRVSVLEDWYPPFPGHHFYYPIRRPASPAFAPLVDALRYRH